MNEITWNDFQKVDIRIGTILECKPFPEARKAAYLLQVDLGSLGIKKSSAQITDLYTPKDLIGKQVLCVCNFPPKQIGPMRSEILVTGFMNEKGNVVLATVDKAMKNGARLC